MKRVLVVACTSALAHATARRFAADKDRLFLVARDAEKLAAVAEDLEARGAGQVETCVMDVLELNRHRAVIEEAAARLDGLDTVLVAHGSLPDQRACETSAELTRQEFEVNSLSTISLLTHLANYFEQQRAGTIAVISSVAGDRGRQSNYVYGAAKGAVTIFLQGLRNRLHGSGVRVITLKPGFVDTPMTAEFAKGTLWINRERAARDIYRAIETGKEVAYVPWFWRWIMVVIRSIPERVFKRMSL